MPAMTDEELQAGRRLPKQDPPGWNGGGEGSRFDSHGRPRSFEDSMQPSARQQRRNTRGEIDNSRVSISSGATSVSMHSAAEQSETGEDTPFETEEDRWSFRSELNEDSDSSDDDDHVILTRHGRPSKTASKNLAKQQLEAAQQLIALSPGRLKQLLPDLNEETSDAVLLARSLKRGRGKQRQIALVAKLLRQLGGKRMITQQDRIGRAAAGKNSGSAQTAAVERLALAWRDALTAGTTATSAAIVSKDDSTAHVQAPAAPLASDTTSGSHLVAGTSTVAALGNRSEGSFSAADLVEQEVYAACVAVAAVPEEARADFAGLRMLVRKVIQEQQADAEAGIVRRKAKGRGRTSAGRRLLVWLRTLAAASLR